MIQYTVDKIFLVFGIIICIVGILITAIFLFHKPLSFLGPNFIVLGIVLMGIGAYLKYKRRTNPVNYIKQIDDDSYTAGVSGINSQYYNPHQSSQQQQFQQPHQPQTVGAYATSAISSHT